VQGRALHVEDASPPRGAAPWNPAPFFERKEQRSDIAENCVFGRDFLGFPCKKRSFLLFQKFLKIRAGQSPACWRRVFPQGALPLGTLLLSLKERSKEAKYRKLRFRQGFLRVSLQKTQFFAISKVFGVQGDFFKNPPRRGGRGGAPACWDAFPLTDPRYDSGSFPYTAVW